MNHRIDISNSQSRPAGSGVGERLQAARIQKGLSIEDIASRMHLNVQIVKSIEDNNFDDITAPIFVKGYLRAYARIVSLDEEELIQQYSEYYSHEDPPISTTSHLAPELSVADVRIKWTTYLVIIGLAALLAAWWWNKNQDEATPISLDTQGASGTLVQQDAAGGDQTPAPLPADRGEPEPISATGAGQAPMPDSEPLVEQTDASQPEVVQAEEPAATAMQPPPAGSVETVEPQADALPGEPSVEAAEQAAGESAAQTPEPEAAASEANAAPVAPEPALEPAPLRMGAPVRIAPSGSDILSLTINTDSWVDVKDGNDFQMVYHLLRAGQSLELTGSAPFSVFLGNGPGVEIRLNDEPFEFSARIRSDNTARLKIGG